MLLVLPDSVVYTLVRRNIVFVHRCQRCWFLLLTFLILPVVTEKILKGSRTSLWIRNVQMGLPSVLIAYATVYIQDAAAVKLHGFFGGYNNIVWTVIVVQAVGGLIVATVVKVCYCCRNHFVSNYNLNQCLSSLSSQCTIVRGQRIESICNIVFNHYFMHYIGFLV